MMDILVQHKMCCIQTNDCYFDRRQWRIWKKKPLIIAVIYLEFFIIANFLKIGHSSVIKFYPSFKTVKLLKKTMHVEFFDFEILVCARE